MFRQAMGFEKWGELDSKAMLMVLRALKIYRTHSPLNTKGEDALRGALNVIRPEESEAKSE